jgi:hypothetical protein
MELFSYILSQFAHHYCIEMLMIFLFISCYLAVAIDGV